MKIRYSTFFITAILLIGFQLSKAQTSYTFINASATGSNGPNQTQVNAAYTSTSLSGQVTSSNGIQLWTVPVTGNYKIEAFGAQGGGANGGLGAHIQGEFSLLQGQVLHIIVGQQGITESGQVNSVGGGGGSFVVRGPATAIGDVLVIAGGGGGSASTQYITRHANATGAGSNGVVDAGVSNPDGVGGTNGNGGNKSVSGCSLDRGAGGGGFLTNGGSICQTVGAANGGNSFLNGGNGGTHSSTGAQGGFGGGGAVWSTGFRGSGGGGGYSGGGAGQINSDSPNHSGGGGGSYNSGTGQVNTAAVRSGHGQVIITSLTKLPNDAGVKSLVGITDTTCAGSYTAVAIVRNYGNNQINSITVGWSIDGVVQTSKVSTTLIDTINGSGPDTLAVTLDTFSFSAATDIKVWTTLPNSQVDPANVNDTLEINIGNPVNVTTGVIFALRCFGAENGILSSTVSGGKGPYTRMWSNGGTSASLPLLSAGTYTVVVTDAYGCQDSSTIELTQPDSFAITGVITNESSLGNDGAIDVSVTGGTPGYTYEWDNMATTQDISGLTAGPYTLVVRDTNFCIDTMDFVVGSSVGINNQDADFSFEVYPNPSSNGEFTVSVPNASNELVIEVTDLLGKRVFYTENAKPVTRLSLNEQNGLYFVRITDGTKTNTKRLNIER